MAQGNYRIPKIGDGTEESPYRPKYMDGEIEGIDRWGIFAEAPTTFDCTVEGTQDALAELASKPDVEEL